MSIKDIFNTIINFDLTQLSEYIISSVIILVLIVIGWIIFNIFNEFFSSNIGKKTFKILKRLFIIFIFVFIFLCIVLVIIGNFFFE